MNFPEPSIRLRLHGHETAIETSAKDFCFALAVSACMELLRQRGDHAFSLATSLLVLCIELLRKSVAARGYRGAFAAWIIGVLAQRSIQFLLNRDVLRDQNDLRVGASLRYPLSN